MILLPLSPVYGVGELGQKNSTKAICFEAECSIYVPKGVCMISGAPKPLGLVASQQTVLIQKCYGVKVS